MTKPLKEGGWLQGLYEISSTAKEIVGTLRMDLWGNIYRYAKAGATTLAAGKLTVPADQDADWVDKACGTASIGDRTVTLTITAVGGTGIAENYFQGGKFFLNDGTAEGRGYTIVYSSAASSTDTSITITLDDPLSEALTSATEFSLHTSPFMGLVISDSDQTDMPAGVPLVDITATYYGWVQTRGECPVLADDTLTKGAIVTTGADTTGAVEDRDAEDEPIVGHAREAGVDTEYPLIYLTID